MCTPAAGAHERRTSNARSSTRRRAGDAGEQADARRSARAGASTTGRRRSPRRSTAAKSCSPTLTDDRSLRGGVTASRSAALRAMQGDFDEARRLWNEARAIYEELGLRSAALASLDVAAEIELLAGRAGRGAWRSCAGRYDELSELGMGASVISTIGRVPRRRAVRHGRVRRREPLRRDKPRDARRAKTSSTQVMWRVAREPRRTGEIAARRGGEPAGRSRPTIRI